MRRNSGQASRVTVLAVCTCVTAALLVAHLAAPGAGLRVFGGEDKPGPTVDSDADPIPVAKLKKAAVKTYRCIGTPLVEACGEASAGGGKGKGCAHAG